MNTEIIKNGTEIATIYGKLVVTGGNHAGLVYVERYEVSDDGDYELVDSDDRITCSDIAVLMKEVDGKNHKVRYENES